MMKNKRIPIAAASLVAVAAITGSLIAYFAANDNRANLIGIGEDIITVEETFTPPSQEQNFAYRKLVKIKNEGSVPCYIRVAVEFSNSDVQKAASFSYANDTEFDFAPADDAFKSAEIKQGDYYINNLPEGWVYVWEENPSDPAVTKGYYYYKEPVAPEESTSALISWVKMNYGSTAEIQAHDIFIYSESLQTVDPATGLPYVNWAYAWNSFSGVEVSGITINSPPSTLPAGQTAALSATVSPADATDNSVSWSSSDESIASVDQYGRLTAKDVGTVTITAAAANGVSTTCSIEVTAPLNSYRDQNNNLVIIPEESYTVLSSTSPVPSTLSANHYYIINGNVSYNGRVSASSGTKIVLADDSHFDLSRGGILVASGTSLEIYGQTNGTGKLTATAPNDGGEAGIGSSDHKEGTGDITIYGGVIEAKGYNGGAGIGGGHTTDGGKITIYGGTITAQGGECGSNGAGAGIGGGQAASNGTVYIHGGKIKAIGNTKGGKSSAGIGSGAEGGNGGTINIYGGSIEATSPGTAIGRASSSGGSYATVTIGDGLKVYTGTGSSKVLVSNPNSVFNNGSVHEITIE